MIYYISDTHFGHEDCLKHDNRPFKDTKEMEQVLINNWNNKVTNEDDVYILGDFCYRSGKSSSYYLKQLNGKKHLIEGNHDKATLKNKQALDLLESVEHLTMITDKDKSVVLCHYPLTEWAGDHYGVIHVYGHIHANKSDTYEFMSRKENAYNAGCMINNYEPVTLEELRENNLNFKK